MAEKQSEIVALGASKGDSQLDELKNMFLVSYDVHDGNSDDYADLEAVLSNFEASYHYLRSTWLISTNATLRMIKKILDSVVSDTSFVVAKITKNDTIISGRKKSPWAHSGDI